MRNYATQMDAAKRGIVTPEIETVAKKENRPVEFIMERVAKGTIAIPANINHKSLSAEAVGDGTRVKINVNPVSYTHLDVYKRQVVALTLSAAEPSQKKGLAGRTLHGVVTNPIILGILIALPFSFLQVESPAMVAKTLDALANCATPLALLSIGASFEGAKAFKKIVPTSAASFIKLVGLPIVFLPVAVWMGFRGQALVTILIMLGTPAPPAGYVMAKKLHGDAELASSIVDVYKRQESA